MIEYTEITNRQRQFFNTGQTLSSEFRISALKKLKNGILSYEEQIYEALFKDLHKSKTESFVTEVSIVLKEIDYAVKHLKKWMKPQCTRTPLFMFPSRSHIYRQPYGVTLVIAPWNYPFQLLFSPLVGAVAAGNCVVAKPSHKTANTLKVIEKIISEVFLPEYVCSVSAEREEEMVELLSQRFDYIFFTGGPHFGHRVMQSAARFLTPLTLELGGKSPCIVDSDAHIKVAARRIAWGKFLNCGQTCVAPDYLFVHRSVKEPLLYELKTVITDFFGEDPLQSPDYGRIVSDAHFNRLFSLMQAGHIVFGGATEAASRYIAPTLIDNIRLDDAIMQEEIFGPLLPILEFSDTEQIRNYLLTQEKPLALYYFTSNSEKARQMLTYTTSGGACINDVVMHVANPYIPFGGVGNSGMGNYHGKYSFYTFSHTRSVVKSSPFIDIRLKYPPYKKKLNWMKRLIK